MVTDESPVRDDPLRNFERQLMENYPWLVVVMTVLLVVPFSGILEGDPPQWDWLFISGLAVFLITYPLSLQLPDRVINALERLQGAGILRPEEAVDAFKHRLNRSADRWARVVGYVLAVLMGLAWLVAFVGVPQDGQYIIGTTIPGGIVEMTLSIAAGRFMGRALCYSTLARRLKVEGFTLHPVPAHGDGTAGLSPVGRIYFTQAMLVAWIAAFLGFWSVFFPVFPQYEVWKLPYIGLLLIMLALEMVSLFLPLRAFRRILLKWKREALRDASSSHARRDDDRLLSSEQRQNSLEQHRNSLRDYCGEIERMSIWALDVSARWSLVIVNTVLTALLFIAIGRPLG